MKRVGFLGKIIFWLNIIAVIFLAISFATPYIPPQKFPTLSMLSLFVSPENKSNKISGIPTGVTESTVETILQQLIDDIKTEVPDAGFSQNDLLAKSLAKSMAVKTGTSLKTEEMEHLVHQLFACKEPVVSPDNKPVLITMDVTDFDKKFA